MLSALLSKNKNVELDALVLWGLYGSLVTLQLAMLYRISSQLDELMVVGLFWFVFTQKLKDIQSLEASNNLIASLIAYSLIACMIVRSLSFYWFDPSYLNAMPLFIVLAISLMTIGWKIHKTAKELLFCGSLLIPLGILNTWFEGGAGLTLQVITTKLSSFVLYYLGFPVATQGTVIQLPQGSVNVELACTSYAVTFSLLQILFLFILMYPLSYRAVIWVILSTFTVAQIVSVLRVSLLAYVVDQPEVFSFWHDNHGQQIMSTFLILFLGLIYYLFYLREANLENEEYCEV